MSNWKKILLLLVLIFVVDQVFAQGCSQCKLLAEQASGKGSMEVDESEFANNLNFGILWLMAIPYILLMLYFRKRIVRLVKALTGRQVTKSV